MCQCAPAAIVSPRLLSWKFYVVQAIIRQSHACKENFENNAPCSSPRNSQDFLFQADEVRT
jgi:hypothetical protein